MAKQCQSDTRAGHKGGIRACRITNLRLCACALLCAQNLQVENAGLKAQLVQKTVELNNTLAEVLQLLDKGECVA